MSLVGGFVFGMMMAMMGMLPTIAGMVGSRSAVVGFFVHMVISFIFGILFTIFAGIVRWNGIVTGIVYGVILWLLFPFFMMPMMMGMPAFQWTTAAMMSLLGHVVYGLITGIVYRIMAR